MDPGENYDNDNIYLSLARPAAVGKGREVETVCCLPTREAATISAAWATPMKERLVMRSLARSGPSGVTGLSARLLVVEEFR